MLKGNKLCYYSGALQLQNLVDARTSARAVLASLPRSDPTRASMVCAPLPPPPPSVFVNGCSCNPHVAVPVPVVVRSAGKAKGSHRQGAGATHSNRIQEDICAEARADALVRATRAGGSAVQDPIRIPTGDSGWRLVVHVRSHVCRTQVVDHVRTSPSRLSRLLGCVVFCSGEWLAGCYRVHVCAVLTP